MTGPEPIEDEQYERSPSRRDCDWNERFRGMQRMNEILGQKIDDLAILLRGNGSIGLVTEVDRLKIRFKGMSNLISMIVGSAITVVVGLVGFLISHLLK